MYDAVEDPYCCPGTAVLRNLSGLRGQRALARRNLRGAHVLRDSRDIIRRLRQEGYEQVSTAGSHHKFVHRACDGA